MRLQATGSRAILSIVNLMCGLRCEAHGPEYLVPCSCCSGLYHLGSTRLPPNLHGSRIDSMKSKFFTFACVFVFLLMSVTPALAATMWVIPPEAPTYLINPSATGVDVLEAFIETPPRATFDTPGFTNLDFGWTTITVNPTYAVEYGPLSSYLTEDLDIIGTPLTVDIYAFTGCAGQFSATPPVSACPVGDLTDAYQVTFNEGGYVGWTALTADDLALEYSANPDATPEPASMLLIGFGLIGFAVLRYHKW